MRSSASVFCSVEILSVSAEDDEAQMVLVLRHWLTTSSSDEFSRAAATLSLSASCLFTAHTQNKENNINI